MTTPIETFYQLKNKINKLTDDNEKQDQLYLSSIKETSAICSGQAYVESYLINPIRFLETLDSFTTIITCQLSDKPKFESDKIIGNMYTNVLPIRPDLLKLTEPIVDSLPKAITCKFYDSTLNFYLFKLLLESGEQISAYSQVLALAIKYNNAGIVELCRDYLKLTKAMDEDPSIANAMLSDDYLHTMKYTYQQTVIFNMIKRQTCNIDDGGLSLVDFLIENGCEYEEEPVYSPEDEIKRDDIQFHHERKSIKPQYMLKCLQWSQFINTDASEQHKNFPKSGYSCNLSMTINKPSALVSLTNN